MVLQLCWNVRVQAVQVGQQDVLALFIELPDQFTHQEWEIMVKNCVPFQPRAQSAHQALVMWRDNVIESSDSSKVPQNFQFRQVVGPRAYELAFHLSVILYREWNHISQPLFQTARSDHGCSLSHKLSFPLGSLWTLHGHRVAGPVIPEFVLSYSNQDAHCLIGIAIDGHTLTLREKLLYCSQAWFCT